MIRFGVVGNGPKAEKFYQANHFSRQFELTGVCADTLEKALEYAQGKGRIAYTDDINELAQWDGIEAAFVCCSLKDRYEAVLALLKGGKHVLCEAPMAMTLEEVDHLYQTAQEQQVILMEGVPSIYTPSFEKMLPYVESLGKVRHATLQNCHYSMAYEQWKRGIVTEEFDPELSGGALMDLGIHPIASMVRLFGKPQKIHAYGVCLTNQMDITGTILMEYEDMIGEIIYSKISDSAMPSQLQGEEGSMLIREIENIKDLHISRRKVDQAIHFEQSDNIYQHETNYFINMIETGDSMDHVKEMSLATMEILEETRKQMKLVKTDEKQGEM